MKRWTGRRFGVIALVVGVGVAVGGIAYAAIPDASGVIHGCIGKNGGLRVIDSSSAKGCQTGEKPLNWNQTGPTGSAASQIITHTESFTCDLNPCYTAWAATASCPDGTAILGGGGEAYVLSGDTRLYRTGFDLAASKAISGPAWKVVANLEGVPAGTYYLDAQAICSA